MKINKNFFSKYGNSSKDTGSSRSQIAVLTLRINNISDHLKKNKKDFNSERNLIKLVSKRKKMLKYIEKNNIDEYRIITNNLSIRNKD